MKEKVLLISEKPSLKRELENVYTKNKSSINYDIDFVTLAGHVCGYASPSDYDGWNKKWDELFSILPMIPEKWQINYHKDKLDLIKAVKDKLSKTKYDAIICATDPEREGNLIFYLLANKLKIKQKVYRLWVNDLTDKAILSAFNNMVDFNKDTFQKNLTYASILRSRFDWLVGMNYTVAASIKSSMSLKMGRVKTPTLKIVYDNSLAIENFIPSTTYAIECEYKEGFSGFAMEENEEMRFKDEKSAKNKISLLGKTAVVKSIKKEKTKTQAPQLYKLSDLQIQANKQFGYSAEKTLEIVQSLYEKKILSYPRCDCRYISEESCSNFNNILSAGKAVPGLEYFIKNISKAAFDSVKKNSRFVNDKEVNKNSHTALIPTGQSFKFEQLSADEQNILKAVYIRFVSIFYPPLVEEKTALIASNNEVLFKSNGKTLIDKGWSVLVNKKNVDVIIPADIKEGSVLNVSNISAKERTTTPPDRLTEGLLVKEMENASKYVEDDSLRKVLKEAKGIGTQSSRASIISSLIKDGYIDIKKQGKSETLHISDKGRTYIENIKDLDIVSPVLTAEWEDKLKRVEHGDMNSTEFSNEMNAFISENIKKIKSTSMTSFSTRPSTAEAVGKCPRCGCDVIENQKAFSCTGYKNNPPCKFALWKDNKLLASQKKKLTKTMVASLLKKGSCSVKGLTSAKTGNKYDATLKLEDTGTFVNLKIEFNAKKGGK